MRNLPGWTIAAFCVGLLIAPAAPARAQTDWTVVMSGLDNPRGLTFARADHDDDDDGHGDGDGWALYVAEAGTGGPGPCSQALVRGQIQCVGATGAISRLYRGTQKRIITGLPSYAPASGIGATGPHDVSVADGRGYVTIGLGGPQSPNAMRAIFGPQFGWLVKFWDDSEGDWAFNTDIGTFEQTENPGGGPQDSNPYGLLEGAGRRVVVDAGGNSLLRVFSKWHIETIAIFPSRAQGRATDAVPNSIAVHDGAYYVGELTGAPFVPETANVWRVEPGNAPEVFCSGFNFILDLDFDRRGRLYVLEHTSAPFPTGPGTLYRVKRDCTKTPVVTGLTNPTSVTIGPDGDAYISNFGTSPGTGEVIKVELPRRRHDDNDRDDGDED
jgi:hypothetical protein